MDTKLAADGAPEKAGVVAEMGRILRLGVPMSLGYLCDHSLYLVTLAFVGRTSGESALAGTLIACTFSNFAGFAVPIGFLSAQDTLSAQAFGSPHKSHVGVIAQRALFFMAIWCTLCMPAWWYGDVLLEAVGQDAAIAAYALQYLRWMMPTLFFAMGMEVLKRFLSAQGISRAQFWASLVQLVTCSVLHYVFLVHMKLPPGYAGLSVSISRFTGLALLLGYTACSAKVRENGTWKGWTRDAIGKLAEFARLGRSGTVMVCMEWLSVEVLTLMAGVIGERDPLALDVHAVLIATFSVNFLFPFGLGIAGGVRVGNALGAGKPQAARQAAIAVQWLAVLYMVPTSLAIYFARFPWMALYTSSARVMTVASGLLFLLFFITPSDVSRATIGGVMRGAGHQLAGAKINVFSYVCVCVPVAWLLCFHFQLGLLGLWIGFAAGVGLSNLLQCILACRFDWVVLAKEAVARVESEVASSEGDGTLLAEDEHPDIALEMIPLE